MRVKNKLISNTVYIFLEHVSIAFFSFLFWIIIGKTQPPEFYGIIATGIQIFTFLFPLTMLGFGMTVNKLIPELLGRGKKNKIQGIIIYTVKWTGKQLTNLNWCFYHHGPWTQEIEDVLKEMNGREIILEERGKACLIRVGPEGNQSENLDLPKSLVFMLENIRREWAGVEKGNIKKLLNYVYSTAPMVDIKQKHQPEEKATLNLRKERELLLRE